MLEMIFTKSTLFNFVSSSILICLTGFNVMAIEDSPYVMTFLSFLSSCLLQIFLLCFFGDMLMRSSMEIGDAVYKSKWYETKPTIAKNLLLVQTRSQKPCRLTASGFADVNLRAFMKILSTAWSYFALLKTMYSSPRT
ncbi:odorant receptor 67c-like [Epargyreus clarus]|uniref:odorant receptor 67c-like n=1 Tax=Epargyreus clarus TaxID=520877 RepID=UPI003C2B0FF8